MITMIEFPVDLSQDEDGAWVAVFPDVPGCATDGFSRAEALTEAADALSEALARMIVLAEMPPQPSAAVGRPMVAPVPHIAAKFALYRAMRAQGIDRSELARRMGRTPAEVARILDPKAKTGLLNLQAAFAAVGVRVVLSVSDQAA